MVYIVDDDAAVRDSLSILLESHGFAVSECASGNAFLDAYRDGGSGCIVLDMNMPGLSGLEVLNLLRDRRESVPVIAITGRGDPALRARLVEAGALAVFDKPIEAEDLIEALESAFAHRA
jgi:two-component system response regulator FixJ